MNECLERSRDHGTAQDSARERHRPIGVSTHSSTQARHGSSRRDRSHTRGTTRETDRDSPRERLQLRRTTGRARHVANTCHTGSPLTHTARRVRSRFDAPPAQRGAVRSSGRTRSGYCSFMMTRRIAWNFLPWSGLVKKSAMLSLELFNIGFGSQRYHSVHAGS